MAKIYIKSNIWESLNHYKVLFIAKTYFNMDFINILSKIIINSKFTNKDIIRHDYTTRTIINIINDLNLNDK